MSGYSLVHPIWFRLTPLQSPISSGIATPNVHRLCTAAVAVTLVVLDTSLAHFKPTHSCSLTSAASLSVFTRETFVLTLVVSISWLLLVKLLVLAN